MARRIEEYPDWFIRELADDRDKQRAKDRELHSRDRVKFFCKEHGVYEQEVRSHIKITTGERISGCSKCGDIRSSQKRINRNRFPSWFIDMLYKDEDKQRAKDGNIKTSEFMQFYCDAHGAFFRRVGDVIKKSTGEKISGCPKCGGREFPDWFWEELLPEYRNYELKYDTIVGFNCKRHGPYYKSVGRRIEISTGKSLCGCSKC